MCLGHIKPPPRYGQSQTFLDRNNVLIIGGSGGPTFPYSDVWILKMEGDLWKWKQVDVRNQHEGPSNIWSNPACKVSLLFRNMKKDRKRSSKLKQQVKNYCFV